MFFKHKYITQPPVTQSDAVLRAIDDLCELLKGKVPIKGEVRTSVDMLMEIFSEQNEKGIDTPTDKHRERMAGAQANRMQTENPDSPEPEPHVIEPGDDDVRTPKTPKIRHPPRSGPNVIEDDEPPNFRMTRSRMRHQLMSAVEISGSCPSARQASARTFPMQFLCDFAGAVLDAETGDLLEHRQLTRDPK